MADGERGVDTADKCKSESGALVVDKEIGRSEVGVHSSITERAPKFWPPAARSCCNCCCCVWITCNRRIYGESVTMRHYSGG